MFSLLFVLRRQPLSVISSVPGQRFFDDVWSLRHETFFCAETPDAFFSVLFMFLSQTFSFSSSSSFLLLLLLLLLIPLLIPLLLLLLLLLLLIVLLLLFFLFFS